MAIEDGLCLGDLIHAAGGDFVAAFRRFERLRLVRTARYSLNRKLYGIGCYTPKAWPAMCVRRGWPIGMRRTCSIACHGFMTVQRLQRNWTWRRPGPAVLPRRGTLTHNRFLERQSSFDPQTSTRHPSAGVSWITAATPRFRFIDQYRRESRRSPLKANVRTE